MKKFCPRCGREDVDFYKGFCIDCYREMNLKLEFPKKIELSKCKHCGRWLIKNKWIRPNYNELNNFIKSKIKTNLKKMKVDVELKQDKVLVKITGSLDEHGVVKVDEEREIPFKFRERVCDYCMKKNSSYYEVKIQLRKLKVFDLIKFERIKKFIEKEYNYFSKKFDDASGFWVEEKKEGLDLFFGSQMVAERILKEVRHKYKVKTEKSIRAAGLTQKGKRKGKTTYLIRV